MRCCLTLTVQVLALSACAGDADKFDRSLVLAEIEERTGYSLTAASDPEESRVPRGVRLEDGISEEEAVAIALWNNALFREALAELGFARADLIQAGLLSNPTLSVLFPAGPKQLEFAALLPVDAFLARPGRIAVAELDAERVAARLVEHGLELIERVHLEWASLRLARERQAIAEDVAILSDETAEFQQSRLAGGDLSELEADLARVEAMESRQAVARSVREAFVSEERLKDLLGFDETWPGVRFELTDAHATTASGSTHEQNVERLENLALAARPDVRAAELGIEAAGERAGLARRELLAISAGVDYNEHGREGSEIGPALEMEIPLFDWNQGRRAYLEAGMERAVRQYVTVRRRVVLEVKEAHARFDQVARELRAWREQIVPGLEEALRRAEAVYATGATTRLPVLETRGRLLAARVRTVELAADLDRSRANLERSVGRRLDVETTLTLELRPKGKSR